MLVRKLIMNFRYFKNCVLASAAFVVLTWSAAAATPINNIVLVHGAFVDGSGWQGVYDILVQDGYHVTLVQEPLTSLEEDVAATRRILDRQDGPCVSGRPQLWRDRHPGGGHASKGLSAGLHCRARAGRG
jgi:hypothetical protein